VPMETEQVDEAVLPTSAQPASGLSMAG